MNSPILVGDIGGTHARFAVAEFKGQLHLTGKRDIAGPGSFPDLLRNYIDQCGATLPSVISLAVAGPVGDGAVIFTNRNWRLSEAELLTFGFTRALLLNDFAALALAAPQLPSGQLFALGLDQPGLEGAPIAVMGAGTGFGASCLIRHGSVNLPLACEAGHIGFAPNNDREDAVLKILRARFGRVSVERLLSGPGLENLVTALQELHGSIGQTVDAATIIYRAQAGDELCQEAVAMFCAIYGSVAGDVALAQGARGGVYLAGGIAPKIKTTLATSQFRKRFEDKGRLSYYLQPIATRIISDPDATLMGAALALEASGT
jgi:glucokinase